MPKIALLNQETIDKIAAGEVIERPSSVVKELVENAIDAGASAITVEIKEGGTSFIRITDNGCGIDKKDVPLAFLRHSTSKIKDAADLMYIHSLGFRGEALSSISAIARVELITKTYESLTGVRYVIEGSKEIEIEDIGAPDGTTFLVKDLFYNTPARKKFLKSAQTEGNYISDIVEKLALSHPFISFKFINNNQTKLHTSGNGKYKDLIYHVFGREFASSVLDIDYQGTNFKVTGYIGKPSITRGNRAYENYFINGRYVKSALISKAIEDAYKNYLMQHKYPFTVLYFEFEGDDLDINVHPTKMELRFSHNQEVYNELQKVIYDKLSKRDMIPVVPLEEKKKTQINYSKSIPEPFEKKRLESYKREVIKEDNTYSVPKSNPASRINRPETTVTVNTMKIDNAIRSDIVKNDAINDDIIKNDVIKDEIIKYNIAKNDIISEAVKSKNQDTQKIINNAVKEDIVEAPVQQTLASLDSSFLSKDAKEKHKIIGQLFDTYWLIEYEQKLYIMDQHAAHEKVLYEKTMERLKNKEFTSQMVSPPIIVTLDNKEMEVFEKYKEQFETMGYSVENFGGKEYMINAIPDNLYNIDMKDLFIEMLDDFSDVSGKETPELILEKIASMSCKAAVKGNSRLSLKEIQTLIDDLFLLENPYNCPHGRPTIISMTKYEIEKKFKRIV